MAWEDRRSYRDPIRRPSGYWAAVATSVSLISTERARLAVRSSFFMTGALLLLLGPCRNVRWQTRIECVGAILIAVLMQGVARVLGARWGGNDSRRAEIILTTISGSPDRVSRFDPPSAAAILAGVASLLVLSTACAGTLGLMHRWTINPFAYLRRDLAGWTDASGHLGILYAVSTVLLLANLLPFYPLGGGQLIQAAIWRREGFERAIAISTNTGVIGLTVLSIAALATRHWLLMIIGADGLITCLMLRWSLRPSKSERAEPVDLGLSFLEPAPVQVKPRRRLNRRAVRRLRRLARQEEQDQVILDAILAKVSAHGLGSLTWKERRVLKQATGRQHAGDEPEDPIEASGH